MTLTIGGVFCAEGSPEEISAYAFIMLNLFKKQKETEDAEFAKKEAKLFEKLGTMTFEELLKKEQEDDKEE